MGVNASRPQTWSLPLRINLISLVFAGVVTAVLTLLGGWLLHRQQLDIADSHARVAATSLASRVQKLQDLGLGLEDFIGFDEQCAELIRDDPLLRGAALFDFQPNRLFHSGDMPEGQALSLPPGARSVFVKDSPKGLLLVQPLVHQGALQGYVVTAVDGAYVLAETLRSVAMLLGAVIGLFVLGLIIQQRVFWGQVGRPLRGLIDAADAVRPDNPETLTELVRQSANDDDIGRVYQAFSRLIGRLDLARQELLDQNLRLEGMVRERTAELERVNLQLADDVERLKTLENELRLRATTDELTGLANRAFILPYAQTRMEHARRHGLMLGLILMDLDGFKIINDTHGHAAGDAVLKEVARRLKAVSRSSDMPARLGGDEFLLAFEGLSTEDDALVVARAAQATFAEPVAWQGLSLEVGVSMGVALFPLHAQAFEALLIAADEAMYLAKKGREGIRLAARASAVAEPEPASAQAPALPAT